MEGMVGRESTLLLVIAAVFVTTFLVVCAVAYLLGKRGRGAPGTSTWHFSFGGRLPLSRRAFDVVARQTAAAISKPEVDPETVAMLDALRGARRVFVRVYRVVMIGIGLVGVVAAATMFHAHTPANMYGLPAAIILLLALGALGSGLVPPQSVMPTMEPIDRRLLDKIRVSVTTSEPREISLTGSDLERAAALLRQGGSLGEAARAAYPGYEALDEVERRAMESMLTRAIRKAADDGPD